MSEVNTEVKTTKQQPEQSALPLKKSKRNRLPFFCIFTIILLFVTVFLVILSRSGLLPVPFDVFRTKYSQYKTQRFSISYPADWTLKEGGFYGGFAIRIQPGIISYPIIYIAEYNDLEAIKLIEQINSEYNYKKSKKILADGEATLWFGSRKASLVDWQVQEQIIVLLKAERFYKFTLMYPAREPNNQYEKIFGEIISTFKLQE